MILLRPRFRIRRSYAALACAVAAGCLAQPARAQTTMTPQAGLEQYYKSEHWLPVQVNLTNQGQPVRAEVRVRFATTGESGSEYRIPQRELQSSANQNHTVYLKAPVSYATQSLVLDLYRDGRLINTVRPTLRMLNDGDWLVVGIGNDDSSLKQLTSARLSPTQIAPSIRPWMRNGTQPVVQVATLEPNEVPDRWQGLQAADLLVIGDLSEREFKNEQAAAIRDYVASGGTLVITGGIDWKRLTSPFYRDLLPVKVTGGGMANGFPSAQSRGGGFSAGTSYPIALSEALPGSVVMDRYQGRPMVVKGRKGAGSVYFFAFDPARPPFRGWDGSTEFWKSVLLDPRDGRVLHAIASTELTDNPYGGFGGGGALRLSDAPFAISQLDIPAFYIVALFLLAYIIVLVPVNYFVLKAKDKKEYAWLTTPAIVLVFSVAAYMIGYGFKGGRTLLVKVGVIEAHAGQSSAPFLSYAGLFSPRKTGYDLQPSVGQGSAGDAGTVLLSEPAREQSGQGMRVLYGEEAQKVEDYAVDMWAMRVVKSEGIARLGGGVKANLQLKRGSIAGEIKNETPLTLHDCQLVIGGQAIPVGTLTAGQAAPVQANRPTSGSGVLIPPSLLTGIKGSREEQRMKQAVLQPLSSLTASGPALWARPNHPMLMAWLREPITPISVNGGTPREQTATLLLVHLK